MSVRRRVPCLCVCDGYDNEPGTHRILPGHVVAGNVEVADAVADGARDHMSTTAGGLHIANAAASALCGGTCTRATRKVR